MRSLRSACFKYLVYWLGFGEILFQFQFKFSFSPLVVSLSVIQTFRDSEILAILYWLSQREKARQAAARTQTS